MVQELAPLHEDMCIAVVRGDGLRADHCGGHQARERQREAVVPSLGGPTWKIETVVVDGLQQAFEGGEGRAPHWVLKVVAGAVVGAILLVEADIRAVVEASMGLAARQVGDHIQESW